MASLRNRLLPVYITVGFVAIILAMPASRWVILTQLDVLAGRWQSQRDPMGLWGVSDVSVVPNQRVLQDSQPAPDLDETGRFLRLVSPLHDQPDTSSYDRRFQDLYTICERKSDVRYWAQFIRASSFQGQIIPEDLMRQYFNSSSNKFVQNLLKNACLSAIRIEPDNAFFRVILSGTLHRLGDRLGSRSAFLKAKGCTKYEAYERFEPELRYRYLVDHYGYRGEQVHAWILSNTLLPHLPVIQSVCRHFASEKNIPERETITQIGYLMMGQGRSEIDVIVGQQCMALGLLPAIQTRSVHVLGADEARRIGKRLRTSASSSYDFNPAIDLYVRVCQRSPQWPPDKDAIRQVLNLRPAYSAFSLTTLLLLPLCFGFAWLKSTSPRFASASPYLIWFLAYLSDPMFGRWAAIGTGFGTAWFLFFPALSPKLRRYVDVLGVAVAIAALAQSLTVYPLITPALLFLCILILERKGIKVRVGWSIAGVLLACAVASGCWVANAANLGIGSGILFGVLASFGAFAAIPISEPVRWSQLAGICSIVLGIGFATMVYRDLAADRQMNLICQHLLNDADQAR